MNIMQIILQQQNEVIYVPKEEIVSCSLSFLSDWKYRLSGIKIKIELKTGRTISFEMGKNFLIKSNSDLRTQEEEEKASALYREIVSTFSKYFDEKIKTFFMNGERNIFEQDKLEKQYLLKAEELINKENEGVIERERKI